MSRYIERNVLNSQLRQEKIAGDPRLRSYAHGLQSAIDEYGLKKEHFSSPNEVVVQTAKRLLSAYDVDTSFWSTQGNLFVLAAADMWLSGANTDMHIVALDILKLVTYRYGNNGSESMSEWVKRLVSNGRKDIAHFTYNHKTKEVDRQHDEKLQAYLDSHYDKLESLYLDMRMREWGKNTKLHHVRQNLGVTEYNERPFEVIALNVTAEQMAESVVGGTGLMTYRDSVAQLVVGKDYDKHDSLEHEYAHSQGEGIRFGFRGVLWSGLSEAITERTRENPITYYYQRRVLDFLTDNNPELLSLLFKAYRGDNEAQQQAFMVIIDEFGLRGLLALARMSPYDGTTPPKTTGVLNNRIGLHPEDVYEILRAHERNKTRGLINLEHYNPNLPYKSSHWSRRK